jgi:hypothetical protein
MAKFLIKNGGLNKGLFRFLILGATGFSASMAYA